MQSLSLLLQQGAAVLCFLKHSALRQEQLQKNNWAAGSPLRESFNLSQQTAVMPAGETPSRSWGTGPVGQVTLDSAKKSILLSEEWDQRFLPQEAKIYCINFLCTHHFGASAIYNPK